MLFAALYGKEEYINVVTDFTREEKTVRTKRIQKADGAKFSLRDEWMRWMRKHGTPQSEAVHGSA